MAALGWVVEWLSGSVVVYRLSVVGQLDAGLMLGWMLGLMRAGCGPDAGLQGTRCRLNANPMRWNAGLNAGPPSASQVVPSSMRACVRVRHEGETPMGGIASSLINDHLVKTWCKYLAR